jgi:hypothetical protein
VSERRIIRVDGSASSIAVEGPLVSEEELHRAIATHPEVLPYGDFGLGPLIPLASELGVASGSIDLLAADGAGHLAIIEFKKGTENPDIRHVVAQLLDYGAALWRQSYDWLEERCLRGAVGPADSLEVLAGQRLDPLGGSVDSDAFREGVVSQLASGAFAFVYCGRDLDERTRRIMTYLAEGPA